VTQTAQIQALINQINATLSKPSPRLPWVMSGETARQRQLLEQTRNYLLSLQKQLAGSERSGQPRLAPGRAATPPTAIEQYAQELPAAESAQQVLQAVLQEMSYLRSNVMQPLRTDLEMLHQQREVLQQEIRQLEAQRQQHVLPQAQTNQQQLTNDFLQALMARLQDNLSGQVTQMLGNLEMQAQQERSLGRPTSGSAIAPPNSSSALTPAQRLEQIQALQAQSDQLLLKLDSTLRVVFESLQSNVQSYQDALSIGLEKMHALGQQGEAMFAGLVNRLAQQLGREASSYLQSSLSDWEGRSLTGGEGGLLPSLQPKVSEEVSDAQIDRLLNELGTTAPLGSMPVGSSIPPVPSSPQLPTQNLQPDSLNLNLDHLRLDSSPSPSSSSGDREDVTLFQIDEPFTLDSGDDGEITVFQTEEMTRIQPPISAEVSETGEINELYESLFGTTAEIGVGETSSLREPALPSQPPAVQLESFPSDPQLMPTVEMVGSSGLDGVPDATAALFDGMEDLARSPQSDPQLEVDVLSRHPLVSSEQPSTDRALQSLENFLFGVDEPLLPSDTLEPIQALEAESAPVLPPPAQEVESIASLSDLVIDGAEFSLETPELPLAVQLSDPPVAEDSNFIINSLSDELYIPASPNETLLPTEESEDLADLDLNIDPNIFQQLSADLSSLEELDDPLLPTDAHFFEDDDREDDDRTLALDNMPSRPETGLAVAAGGLLAADLEDLFPQQVSPPLDVMSIDAIAPSPIGSANSGLFPFPEVGEQPDLPSQISELTFEDFDTEALDLEAIAPTEPISEAALEDLLGDQIEVSSQSTAPVPPPLEPALTLEDFSQGLAPSQPVQKPAEDLFSVADLEDLFSNTAVSKATTLEDQVAPSLPPLPQDQLILGELFFSDPSDTPTSEALAPEEEGLTLEDFAEDVAFSPAEISQTDRNPERDRPTALPISFTEQIDPNGGEVTGDSLSGSVVSSNLFDQNTVLEDLFPVETTETTELQPDVLTEGISLDSLAPSDPLAQTVVPPPDADIFAGSFEEFESLFDTPGIDTSLVQSEQIAVQPSEQTSSQPSDLAREDLTQVAPIEVLPSSMPANEPSGFVDLLAEESAFLTAEESAFSLEGLDRLFEDWNESGGAADPPPAVKPVAHSVDLEDTTLESLFEDLEQPSAAMDEADFFELEAIDPESEDPQKKKIVSIEAIALGADWETDAEQLDGSREAFAARSLEVKADSLTALPETDLFDFLESDLAIEPTSSDTLVSNVEVAIASETLAQAVPPQTDEAGVSAKSWCLGIDIGTTGISAVLLNRLTYELHPIYWAEGNEKSFRLPTAVYPHRDKTSGTESIAIGSLALELARQDRARADTEFSQPLLHDFKPYLKMGIPYDSPHSSWEPVLQWSEQHMVSLHLVHQSLQSLLATLSVHRLPVRAAASQLTCGAVGLEVGAFQAALQQLAQVAVGYPVNWSDTYSLNIREAILGARLVAQPEQVCFIEDAIASLLSGLCSADGRAVILPNGLAQKSHLHNTNWHGGTLAISAGATVTELALVDLPNSIADIGEPQLQQLTYRDFTTRSLPYAGNAIDQDIICQLLYPSHLRQSRRTERRSSNLLSNYTFGSSQSGQSGAFVDGWNWQAIDSEQSTWESLSWSDLTLPLPGEPDLLNRQCLQQRLESSPLGQTLLEAAKHLKLIFQHQDQFTLELGDQQWHLSRQELGSRVILPYVQRLNRELNALLVQTGMSVESIQQVVCTGGTASLRAIARWLRQKLPNATIIQDTYVSTRAVSPQEYRPLTCSRIAYGLATLPLHPQVLDIARQQYSDYFLLLELLRAFPDQPLPAGRVMQLLEQRGINTQVCHLHILALLEGHLPPGLVPIEKDANLLTSASRQNPEYKALLEAPLFHKRDNQTYEPNNQQRQRFLQYLAAVLANTHQTLTEPLTVDFVERSILLD
jgi:hypothetical protein